MQSADVYGLEKDNHYVIHHRDSADTPVAARTGFIVHDKWLHPHSPGRCHHPRPSQNHQRKKTALTSMLNVEREGPASGSSIARLRLAADRPLFSRFRVHQHAAPAATATPRAGLLPGRNVHHRPPRKCLVTDPLNLGLMRLRFTSRQLRACTHKTGLLSPPEDAVIAGGNASFCGTVPMECPRMNWLGSNTSPSTCKSRICCGTKPSL